MRDVPQPRGPRHRADLDRKERAAEWPSTPDRAFEHETDARKTQTHPRSKRPQARSDGKSNACKQAELLVIRKLVPELVRHCAPWFWPAHRMRFRHPGKLGSFRLPLAPGLRPLRPRRMLPTTGARRGEAAAGGDSADEPRAACRACAGAPSPRWGRRWRGAADALFVGRCWFAQRADCSGCLCVSWGRGGERETSDAGDARFRTATVARWSTS